MAYGGAGKVPDANIDKMVAELNERYAVQTPCKFILKPIACTRLACWAGSEGTAV